MSEERLAVLIRALQDPARFDHPVTRFDVLETHISTILLTGPYAYKFKKPVDLGFLDFTRLERRKFYCEEELRLNRRLAPALYLEVVPVTGGIAHPSLHGDGPAIEYALKMVEFPQSAQLDRVLAHGALTAAHVDRLADDIALFHAQIAVAGRTDPFGAAAAVRAPVIENFAQIRPCLDAAATRADATELERWSEHTLHALGADFDARKRDGHVRECHGDMHLANMALLDDRVVVFDCLEFNANLRWIDIMSEIAFLVMDLDYRGRADLARRFLNRYLERCGDYAGLRVLRHYLVYRALVRAKVACIRLRQGVDGRERDIARSDLTAHLGLALRYTQPRATPLVITHGLSGAGKTVLTQALLEQLGAIRVRSDIERKRLFGLAAEARGAGGIEQGLYQPDATLRTYDRLRTLAQDILAAGYPVIVDATFLKHAQRAAFHALAEARGVPFIVLDCRAPEAVLRTRIGTRADARTDASEASLDVLEHQLRAREPLTRMETPYAIAVDTDRPYAPGDLAAQILARPLVVPL